MNGMNKDDICRSCVDCGIVNCDFMDKLFPPFCLTTQMEPQLLQESLKMYDVDNNKKVAIAAAEVEAENYCTMTRIQEVVEFAKKMDAHKIGIATCVGLIRESRVVARILRQKGFEVWGIGCKAGIVPKSQIGIPKKCECIGKNMCNPIMQAFILNKEKTDLNVVVGLCVGHDSLFYKYSEALCTTLITKDRVLGHNPVAAIYQADAYYHDKLF